VEIPDKPPKNVKFVKWLPQQDLLGVKSTFKMTIYILRIFHYICLIFVTEFQRIQEYLPL